MIIAKAWQRYFKECLEGRNFSENQLFTAKKAFYAGFHSCVFSSLAQNENQDWFKSDSLCLGEIKSIFKELLEWSESLRAQEEAVEAARKARGGCC